LNEYYLNQTDKVLWEQIKDSPDPAVVRSFIERFPSSSRLLDARIRLDTLDRTAREAARALAAEEARAKAAAAEQQRAEREAAQRRKDEEERAKVAAAERERIEREAAQKREQEERAKVAAAERERAEREAAQKRQDEEQQRVQLALLERERLDREAAKRIQAEEEQQRQKAQSLRRGLERESGIVVVPASPGVTPPQSAPAATLPITPAPAARPAARPAAIPQAQACKQDEERLTSLRANQNFDEVVRFEQELTCARLRPQVMRLRESLAPSGNQPSQVVRRQPEPVVPQQQPVVPPAPAPPLQSLEHQAVRVDPAPAAQAQDCQRDEERLVRLRASQDRNEVVRFEKELTCTRLRAQVLRLRESLGGDPAPSERSVTIYGAEQQATVKIDPAPIVRAQDCEGDEKKLVQLRASQVRDDIIRFAQDLTCDKLRLQVQRLKESVGVN
jgi:hypothetical protein